MIYAIVISLIINITCLIALLLQQKIITGQGENLSALSKTFKDYLNINN